MIKNRLFILGSGFLGVLGIAFALTVLFLNRYAGCPSCGPVGGAISVHEWAAQIDFTPEQKRKIEPYEDSLKKDLQSTAVKLAGERISLTRLIQEESADSKKVTEYAERISNLEAEQKRLVINHLIVTRDLLNPDQREKLFSSLTHKICTGCREMVPGQQCLCGMCKLKGRENERF